MLYVRKTFRRFGILTQKERMLAELPYKAWLDGLTQEREKCQRACFELNGICPTEREKRKMKIKEIFGKTGNDIHVESPFYCDYGYNIEVGESFYSNYNCVILDTAKVTIGDSVMFGPNVSLYTAGHPLHPESRNSGYEYGISIKIGNNVWIGGNTVVTGGVTVGNNCVIGAGSVVTKDIPDNSLAVGNPCRVIRQITEDDRDFYFKGRKFDVTDYR